MSATEENKALARRWYEEIVGTGNDVDLPDVVSPDYVEVHDNVRYPIGLAGAREHVAGVRRTYPDLVITVERQIAEGEWVATQITARGTHQGEWLGIRPTGKRVAFSAVNLDRIVDGRIVEHGGAANMLGPLLEIGAVRVVGAAEPDPDRP
jgi:predicted ester cyclase